MKNDNARFNNNISKIIINPSLKLSTTFKYYRKQRFSNKHFQYFLPSPDIFRKNQENQQKFSLKLDSRLRKETKENSYIKQEDFLTPYIRELLQGIKEFIGFQKLAEAINQKQMNQKRLAFINCIKDFQYLLQVNQKLIMENKKKSQTEQEKKMIKTKVQMQKLKKLNEILSQKLLQPRQKHQLKIEKLFQLKIYPQLNQKNLLNSHMYCLQNQLNQQQKLLNTAELQREVLRQMLNNYIEKSKQNDEQKKMMQEQIEGLMDAWRIDRYRLKIAKVTINSLHKAQQQYTQIDNSNYNLFLGDKQQKLYKKNSVKNNRQQYSFNLLTIHDLKNYDQTGLQNNVRQKMLKQVTYCFQGKQQLDMRVLTFNKPSFYHLIKDQYQLYLFSKKNQRQYQSGKYLFQINIIFLMTLRIIFDQRYKYFLLYKNQIKCSFIEYVYSWIKINQINNQFQITKKITNQMQPQTFYYNLYNSPPLLQIQIFRQFLEGASSEDQIFFILNLRNQLLVSQNIEFSTRVEPVLYTRLENVYSMFETKFKIEFVRKKQIKVAFYKASKIIKNVRVIDVYYPLKVFLQIYRFQRLNRLSLIKKIFHQVSQNQNQINFFQFMDIFRFTFIDMKLEEKVALYRQCYAVGKGAISYKIFFVVANQKQLFLKYTDWRDPQFNYFQFNNFYTFQPPNQYLYRLKELKQFSQSNIVKYNFFSISQFLISSFKELIFELLYLNKKQYNINDVIEEITNFLISQHKIIRHKKELTKLLRKIVLKRIVRKIQQIYIKRKKNLNHIETLKKYTQTVLNNQFRKYKIDLKEEEFIQNLKIIDSFNNEKYLK